eukprot:4458498-Pleurochrysis_carterae.AAC.4
MECVRANAWDACLHLRLVRTACARDGFVRMRACDASLRAYSCYSCVVHMRPPCACKSMQFVRACVHVRFAPACARMRFVQACVHMRFVPDA